LSVFSPRPEVRTPIPCLCNELKPAGKNIEIKVLPVDAYFLDAERIYLK
jgi:hypothetical protein